MGFEPKRIVDERRCNEEESQTFAACCVSVITNNKPVLSSLFSSWQKNSFLHLLESISVSLCDRVLRQKNDHGVRSASTVVCWKSIVESHWAICSQYLGYAIHDALVRQLPGDCIWFLGHKSTLDQIKRHGKSGSGESSTQRRQDTRW